MQTATAACLAILVGSILCMALGAPARVVRAARRVASLVGVVAALVLVEYVNQTDLVIVGGRFSPWVAVALILLVAGVNLAGRRPRLGQALLVLGAVPGYVAFVGYVTGVAGLYEAGASVPMALATASAIPLVAVAGLAVVPDGWIPRIQTDSSPAALLRRVLPAAFVLVPVPAAVADAGSRNHWWSSSFGVALQSFGATVVAAGCALWAARTIGHVDRMRQDADRRAHEDALTGAGNRWALERTLEGLFDGPMPPTTGILMLLDLDDFKGVNDRFGHLQGDRALAAFAEVVRANLRTDDVFIRLGGDEFAVVCADADPNSVLDIVNRILLALERRKVNDPVTGVTASIGVAACDGTVRTAQELLGRADTALYRAKQSGKSRFCFHPTAWADVA
ncbi:MAG: GGDEF domain-containing protein [Actinomycetota bacterium]|nr:GGDEF domain-containing protein [Actinomycetota bacterium]